MDALTRPHRTGQTQRAPKIEARCVAAARAQTAAMTHASCVTFPHLRNGNTSTDLFQAMMHELRVQRTGLQRPGRAPAAARYLRDREGNEERETQCSSEWRDGWLSTWSRPCWFDRASWRWLRPASHVLCTFKEHVPTALCPRVPENERTQAGASADHMPLAIGRKCQSKLRMPTQRLQTKLHDSISLARCS